MVYIITSMVRVDICNMNIVVHIIVVSIFATAMCDGSGFRVHSSLPLLISRPCGSQLCYPLSLCF